jgi:Mlc titration factor MtfA (ptsG expression regulator)
MCGWYRRWRRKRLLESLFPARWNRYLEEHVSFYPKLPPDVRQRFLDYLRIFVHEKRFFGAGGFVVEEIHKVLIAAAAVRLILFLDLSYYDHLAEIVVYPWAYRHPEKNDVILGEAHRWGTVVLSWPSVLQCLEHPMVDRCTAYHEFAHVLDMTDGSFDGTPRLHSFKDYYPWAKVMSRHFLEMRKKKGLDAGVLRDYGAKNEAEFFAVATEAFFVNPLQLRERAPDLYEELKSFYGLDPEVIAEGG